MNNYEYIPFSVLDFKNENVLSSYALTQTPLTFYANISSNPYLDYLWEFGDNTYSDSITAKKFYNNPGKYVVNLTVFDCFSKAIISTDYKIIEIFDFFPKTFKVDFDNINYYDNIEWKIGKINGPIYITALYPSEEEVDDIFYRVDGSSSDYYFDNNDKYNHLVKNYSIYDKIYNHKSKSFQFEEIDRISTTNSEVYAKIQNSSIVFSDKSDPDSFFVGLSGFKELYFKNDSLDDINIQLFFDKSKNQFKGNILNVTLSAKFVDNDDVERLSITSNGLDGEFYPVSSFNIDSYKFNNTDIPIVFKIKDNENYSVKNFPNLSANQINIQILSSGNVVNSSYYTIQNYKSFNGSAIGILKFNLPKNTYNLQISASLSTINDQNSAYFLSCVSNYFDVFNKNTFTIAKKNEDFDAKETFKELRFQEILLDKNVLFEDFMGSIFGTLSSSYDTLGKKIYEKISNFVDNIQNVDRNEIVSLLSQMKMMDLNTDVYSSNLFTYPEKIKRIIDLASIKNVNLLGVRNQFKENFDIKGFASKEFYGRNLGEEIDTKTYVITAGIPIVALEKFSNTYTLLNTEQPVEYVGSNAYPLSSYNNDWGWPLVLPSNFTFDQIDRYYIFFKYVDVVDGSIVGNTIIYDPNVEKTLIEKNAILDENFDFILSEEGDILASEFLFDYLNHLLNVYIRDIFYQSLMLIDT
jgi:hypothetical protein